jgi:predicted phosphohydrolase
MSVFIISDLHLSFSEKVDKPMDIFGREWMNHTDNVKAHWESMVSGEDTVIVPGDISWALKLEDAAADLEWIRGLPGNKIFIKGNHDMWWVSVNKLNAMFGSDDMRFLQNNFYEADGYAVCGSRGWLCPGDEDFAEQDEKIYKRELLRLRASLNSAREAGYSKIIGALHFPPMNDRFQESGFTGLFEEFGVKNVFYGHLHGADRFRRGVNGNVKGVEYRLVSLDYLKCKPLKLEV